MRTLRESLRQTDWLRTVLAALIVLSLAFAGPALGQDAGTEDPEDDFVEDDFLLDDDYDDDFEDDFLSDDFAEQEEPAYVQEKGAYYWAFEVPVDILILRPAGAIDLAVGGMFAAFITPPLVVFAGFGSIWDAGSGKGWYYDTTNIDTALDVTVTGPSEFLFDRPLGQLVSF